VGIKEKFSKKDKSKKSTKDIVKKELHEEYQEDKKQAIGHAKRIKQLWRSKEIVQLKTEAIAILWKKRGYEAQFFDAFDKITKEGYQLVLTEGVKALDAGPIDVQIGNYYYFQHRNFIK
jgi:hypothetical protein